MQEQVAADAMTGKAWWNDVQLREIPLEGPLLQGFCRRGRRRLHEIEEATKASVKLDRARGLLRVVGTEDAINAVEHQLECMTGPRKEISRAAWAELMRTRTGRDEGVALAQIQTQSGCRVHIERSRNEVRLFGPKNAVAMADKLLDDLQKMCVERLVSAPTANLNLATLNDLAQALCVTFRLENDIIFILGLKVAVSDASHQLSNYLANPNGYMMPSADGAKKVAAEIASLNSEGSPSATTVSGEVYESGSSDVGGDWSPTYKADDASCPAAYQMPMPTSPAMQAAPLSPCIGQQAMVPVQPMGADSCVCQNCGASKFCGHCGNQIWVVTPASGGYPMMMTPSPAAMQQPSQPAQPMQMKAMMQQANYFQVSQVSGPHQGMMPQMGPQMGPVPVGR
mmetsp:Transcript_39197/g.73086  ORF Transcript_39197/g.73086 Transcript_39197/m.73086 type:complete len:397 (+) Transcript_39197:19-1209(+)